MTRLEAIERAQAIWGQSHLLLEPALPRREGAWYVTTGDGKNHKLDANGHADCHVECVKAEARIGETLGPDLEKCAAGMKLLRVTFIMQVGAGAPPAMVRDGIRRIISGDPATLDRLKGNGMGERTINSVTVEEITG